MSEKSITTFKYKPNYIYLIIGIFWLLWAIFRTCAFFLIIPPISKTSMEIANIILNFITAFLWFSMHYKRIKSAYLILDGESISIRINHLGWTHKILWLNVLKVYGNEKRVYLEEKKNEKIRTHSIYLSMLSKEDAEQLLPLIQSYKGE